MPNEKVSSKFRAMSAIYKIFAEEWESILDFSEDALREMYAYESRGVPIQSADNGFEVGKRWLNVHVAMWRKDIQDGILFKWELYADSRFPHTWLDKVL